MCGLPPWRVRGPVRDPTRQGGSVG